MSVFLWKLHFNSDGPVLSKILVPENVDSLDSATKLAPGGAYTTFRTFDRQRALHLEAHLDRLELTAALAGQPVQLDHKLLRRAIAQANEEVKQVGELRLRLILDLEHEVGEVYLCAEPFKVPPAEAYFHGVKVITCHLERALPKAKLTRFIAKAGPIRQSLPPGVNEAVMVNAEGQMLEGLSSNFFAVLDGEIWTAGEGVLDGITRALVLEAGRDLRIPMRMEPPEIKDLARFQEAFITSSGRGLLPVCQVDELAIGNGKPGPITLRVMASCNEHIQADLEAFV